MTATTRPEFNPSHNEHVYAIKEMTERLLQYMDALPQSEADPRCRAIAITQYEQAAMWAVKAVTTNET